MRTSSTPSSAAAPHRPRTVAVVGALVLLEAAVLAALTVVMLLVLVRGSDLPGPVAFLMLLAAGVAALLVGAARGLWRGRRWARSPVMTWQVLLIALSVGWLGNEAAWWSIGVLVIAVVIAIGLLLPPVVAWTTTAGPPGPDTAELR